MISEQIRSSLYEPHEETITVINKVYPEWGDRNGWMVCVGGINDKGEWRRLYPLPYDLWWNIKRRHLAFKKWDIIRLPIKKRKPHKDPRKESYEPINCNAIEIVDHIGTKNGGWEHRRNFIDKYLSPGMKTLNAKRYEVKDAGQWSSMGVIKPAYITDFVEKDRLSVGDDIEAKQVMGVQMRLLTKESVPPTDAPDPINKKIGFRFKCGESHDGCETCSAPASYHYIMCTDWEVGALYRKAGFKGCREKLMELAKMRDIYLMMGTVAKSRQWMTFINVGIFYPPR